MGTKARNYEAEFWAIIGKIDVDEEDEEAALEPAVEALSSRPVPTIRRFEDILAAKLRALDGEAYAREVGRHAYGTRRFSPDLFLYARCFVVAQGRKVYERVLANPEEMPKDREFEALLDLSAIAFEEKTGEEFDHVSRIDYETFSNERAWG